MASRRSTRSGLSVRDYARMLDLAVHLLECEDPQSLWGLVGEELLHGLRGSLGLVKDVDWTADEGEVRARRPQEPEGPLLDPRAVRWVRSGFPFAQHYGGGGRGPVAATGIVGARAWHRGRASGPGRDCFGRHDVLGMALPVSGGVVRGFLVHREEDFAEPDLEYARRVQPLVEAADAQRRQLARWRSAVVGAGPAPAVGAGEGVTAFRLTPRELTVLSLLGEALPATAIARRLRISPRTVHKHVQHIYRKLGTSDRLAAVLRAQAAGLLPPREVGPQGEAGPPHG